MTRKTALSLVSVAMAALLGLGAPLLACEKREKSRAEKVEDKAKDAVGMREHEKLKDAGENAKDALEDARDAAKDE